MELLRYVTLDVGGRPSVLLDLADQVNFAVVTESFQATFGQGGKQAVMSAADRRYGGERQHGEITPNGQITWSALVMGGSADATIATVESMLAQLEANPQGLLLEWRPDGASQSSLFEVRGTASWSCKYKWAQFSGAQSMVFDVSVPVAPLARGLPMDILDLFAVDTRGDYTYDSGASGNEEVTGGALKAAANVNTEQRAIHTARGYQYADSQQTTKGIPKATISGWKSGVVLKRVDATNYLEVYVDDEGTNSRLRIDKIVAGVRTNLKTTNLAARVANGVAHWVRGRIEGNVVTAEYFTEAPTPCAAPTLTNTQTLTAGDITAFGAAVRGAPGRVWIPKTVGAEIDEYAVEPYTYRNLSLPQQIVLGGVIPGDAPAKADITITAAAGATNKPPFALIGWCKKPSAGLAQAPFGIIEAESGVNLSGWASVVAAGTRSGKALVEVGSGTAIAKWPLDPSLMVPDTFTNEVAIEVWARMLLPNTLKTPTMILSAHNDDGSAFGQRFTDEWGSIGKLLIVPAAEPWTFVRLGVLRMLVDPLRALIWKLMLEAKTTGTGEWGIDYLVLVPAGARACSPTGKPSNETYPQFIRHEGAAEIAKTVRHDLSGVSAKPPHFGYPDHGLGGQLIELPPGEDELLVKLSSIVPDEPEGSGGGEILAHTATVHAAVTPRWYLTRSGS